MKEQAGNIDEIPVYSIGMERQCGLVNYHIGFDQSVKSLKHAPLYYLIKQ